jgi:hypothetical protein
MAATQGNLITASTYNAIRAKVNKVVGGGDGAEFGYGQTLSSQLKADNDLISAQDMQNLYDDILIAAKHQTGDPVVWTTPDGLNAPDSGEIIGVYAADLGPAVTTTNPVTGEQTTVRTTINADFDTDEGYLDFEQAAAQIESGYLDIGPGALTTTIAETSIRTSNWQTSIDHVVTVRWNSAEHRRTWANAGGKIRFNANLTGGTSQPGNETATPPGTKDEIWQTMLNTMGTIEIGVLGTSATGTGDPNANLSIIYTDRSINRSWATTSPANKATVFTKNGSGVYSENEYKISAAEVDDNAIRFYITFKDFDIGDSQDPSNSFGVSVPIDEFVTGTVTSTISFVTPDGFLDIATPSITRDSAL